MDGLLMNKTLCSIAMSSGYMPMAYHEGEPSKGEYVKAFSYGFAIIPMTRIERVELRHEFNLTLPDYGMVFGRIQMYEHDGIMNHVHQAVIEFRKSTP